MFVVSQVERSTEASLKPGVGRFVALLEAIGLVLQLNATMKKALLELSALRNNLAHAGGTADKKYRAACPWVVEDVGTPLRIGMKRFGSLALEAVRFRDSVWAAALLHDSMKRADP